jgi:hypothetical protein
VDQGFGSIHAANLIVNVATLRGIRQLEAELMAQFDALNTALDDLGGSVDALVERLSTVTVEDPTTQASIDAAVVRIQDARARIDEITGTGPAAPATADVPSDTTTEPPADTSADVPTT